MTEITEQAKDYVVNRLKSPYYAAVIAVWLVTNRVLVFGLFNFDADLTMAQRIEFVQHQLYQFNYLSWICGWRGFWATVAWSALWGFVAMVVADGLNTIGKWVYNHWEKLRIAFLRRQKQSEYIERFKYDELENRYDRVNEKWNRRNDEILGLEESLKAEREKITKANELIGVKTEEFNAKLEEEKREKEKLQKQIEEKTKQNLKIETKHAEEMDRADKLRDRLNGYISSKAALDILQGNWENTHVYPSGRTSKEKAVIEGDKYYSLNSGRKELVATISNASYDSETRQLIFVKRLESKYANTNVPDSGTFRGKCLLNVLQVTDDGLTLTGLEDGQITIRYEKPVTFVGTRHSA